MSNEVPKLDSVKHQNLKQIKDVLEQYDLTEYMRGMYNGAELIMAILEEREPNFK